jgi:hypothetical protein
MLGAECPSATSRSTSSSRWVRPNGFSGGAGGSRVALGGEHHDARGQSGPDHRADHVHAAEARHAQVHERDVGTQLMDLVHGLLAIGGLGGQLEIRAALEHVHKRAPEQRMVHDHRHPPAALDRAHVPLPAFT